MLTIGAILVGYAGVLVKKMRRGRESKQCDIETYQVQVMQFWVFVQKSKLNKSS